MALNPSRWYFYYRYSTFKTVTVEEFKDYWEREYPEAHPIGYELKWKYSNRWFRIHSLPESKRYADTEADYMIILDRQNRLINDLIGNGTELIVTFGLYTDDVTNDNYKELKDFGEFKKIQTLDLHKDRPDEYEDETYLDIFAKVDIWETNDKNDLLKAIADDEIRAMFVCPSKQCIIAPYDGGVDVIVDSTERRDEIKLKYQNWLSERSDGM